MNPTFDQHLLETMAKANEEDLAKLEEKLVDAQENLGESEISDALLAKAEYISRIGDKVAIVNVYFGHDSCYPGSSCSGIPHGLRKDNRAWLEN